MSDTKVTVYKKNSFGQQMDRLYWKPDKVKESHSRAILELFASYVFVLVSILPSSLKVPDQINTFWSAIGNINIVSILWGTTFFTLTFLIFRRYSIHATPIPTVMGMATRKITWQIGLHYSFWQWVGGFLAGFTAYYFAVAMGRFETANMIDGIRGSTLGAATPSISGWFYTYNNPINLQGQYWYYAFSIILLLITTSILIIGNAFAIRISNNARQLMVYRWLIVLLNNLIVWKWGSISINPIRMVVPSVVTWAMGGAYTFDYSMTILLGWVIAFSIVIIYSRKKMFDEIKVTQAEAIKIEKEEESKTKDTLENK